MKTRLLAAALAAGLAGTALAGGGARPRARAPLSKLFLPVVLVVSNLKTHG